MDNGVLGANKEYVQQTKVYGKKDALLSFVIFGIEFGSMFLLRQLLKYRVLGSSTRSVFITSGAVSLFFIGIVLLFCSLRKQKANTIGFSITEMKQSFYTGAIGFTVILVLKWLTKISSKQRILEGVTKESFVMNVVYFLVFVALMEEIVIRGYIATRLYGSYKNKWLSIATVGMMFAITHIPMYSMRLQISMWNYTVTHIDYLIKIALYHCFFQWIFSKYNSILAPIMIHFMIDFPI